MVIKATKKVKPKILMILLSVLFIIVAVYLKNYYEEKSFLSTLVGEIVFMQRDDAGILNIYKISADGRNRQMLYHNEDSVNSNSMSPLWSEDGHNIYFSAMRDGKWVSFSIDSEGNNLTILPDGELISFYDNWRLNKCPICIENKNGNLDIREGDLYYINELGNEIKIYSIINYDHKINPGANSPSWSPDKNFIVFESCELFTGCNIYIANKEGTKLAKLAKGREPDWNNNYLY